MKFCKLFTLALMIVTLASCSSHRNTMEYFVDIDSLPEEIPVGDYSVKIEPSDELFISVNSSNPEATINYNLPAANPMSRESTPIQTTPQQQTYTVDPAGDIYFPMIGRIHVQGMTVEELREYLTKKISIDVEDPMVYVQMIKFNIIVSGEVHRPGRQSVDKPRYSILDAIAQAGDLNQYGRRDNVLLIREEDGKLKHVRINLNNSDIFTSPYFYLKQNDYIYVEPNEIRKDNAEYNQYDAYKLSVITTIVSGSASIISLIIALSR